MLLAEGNSMFQWQLSKNISDGDLDEMQIGTGMMTGPVLSGLLQVTGTGASTVTVTITFEEYSYDLPSLDLSDADNVVPIVLPILSPVEESISVATTVTGSTGQYTITLTV
jgi:hypothetical protein